MTRHKHSLPQLIVKADKYNNAAAKSLQGYVLDHAAAPEAGKRARDRVVGGDVDLRPAALALVDVRDDRRLRAALAAAPFPKLVVSGGHDPAFDAVCDVLEQRLGAERAVIPGAGHSVQRTGAPFNERLETFLRSALQ